MNWRERVSVSIPCFGNRFSAVLYITHAHSIQMIQQLLGSPVVYQFYDMRFFVREASSPPCYTTSCWYIIHYYNLHLFFEGFWFGFFEDLRRFSGILAISRLGSRR